MGADDITIVEHDRIVQMVLHEVREGGKGYSGRYQDSRGVVEAK
jgi:dCTP deaminase